MTRRLVRRLPRWFLVVLATGVVCAVLIGAGVFSAKALSRRSALRAVKERHGTYGVRLAGPAWVRDVVGKLGGDPELFYNALHVSLGPGNEGYDAAHPVGDPELRGLAQHLAAFPDLEVLDLRHSDVSDDGIASLPALPALKVLRLSGTRVTDGVAQSLAKFPRLAEVWVARTAVTEQGVGEIKRRCPGCAVKQ